MNPRAQEIHGLKCLPSLSELPEPPDIVHITINGKDVPEILHEMGRNGMKLAIISSAGFRETGEEGRELERNIIDIASQYGIRILGPNCLGVMNTDDHICNYSNFLSTIPSKGGISLLSQSGSVIEVINQKIQRMGGGVRIEVSSGNSADIQITELLDCIAHDEETRTIILYVENFTELDKLHSSIYRAVNNGKKVLGIHGGRSYEGFRASLSHTGILSTNREAIESIFHDGGALSFRDLDSMCASAVILDKYPALKGKGVGIITNSGGLGILAVDRLKEMNILCPELHSNIEKKIKNTIPPGSSSQNPIDTMATGDADDFEAGLSALEEQDDIDLIIILFSVPFFVDAKSILERINNYSTKSKKPVLLNLSVNDGLRSEFKGNIENMNIPVIESLDTAVRAVSKVLTSSEPMCSITENEYLTPRKYPSRTLGQVKAQPDKRTPEVMCTMDKSFEMVKNYGIPCAVFKVLTNNWDPSRGSIDIPYPLYLKASGKEIIHKKHMGAIISDVNSLDELRESLEYMKRKLGMSAEYYIIQETVSGNGELALGAKRVNGLGYNIMFGIGGSQIENLRDHIFMLSRCISSGKNTLTKELVTNKICSLSSFPILNSFFELGIADFHSIVSIILNFEKMLRDHNDITEIDINPLVITDSGLKAVDVRIFIE